MDDWKIYHKCGCGDETMHTIAFANPWFFHEKLCASCGERLRHSTKAVTARWVPGTLGIFKPKIYGHWEFLK